MLEENPDSAWTAYNLALALEAMNDTKGAEDALRKAIDMDPKLAKLQRRIGPTGIGARRSAIRAEVAAIRT